MKFNAFADDISDIAIMVADDISDIAIMVISVFDTVENFVGKGENAGYQHFLFFPQCFPKASFSRSLKVGVVLGRVNPLPHSDDLTP